VIGTAMLLILFSVAKAVFDLSAVTGMAANQFNIAIAHSIFNILCTAILMPAAGLLEKLSYKLIPEPASNREEKRIELDERLMTNPAVALQRCRVVTGDMAALSMDSLRMALDMFEHYDAEKAAFIREEESMADDYEDILGSYLVKLSTHPMSPEDSHETTKLLHMIGDLERISDHAVNILESAEELRTKGLTFSEVARTELDSMFSAVRESVDLALTAFETNNLAMAARVEPLEDVVDQLKEQLRSSHILRMQKGECSIEAGFIWNDLLTDLERVSDHCSNIAGCTIEMSRAGLNLHSYLRSVRGIDSEYMVIYEDYAGKYLKGISIR